MLSRQALLLRSVRAAVPRAAVAPSFVQTRTFASAPPSSGQNVKPPVALFGLDGTYATALYTAAVKSSTLDPTAKSLTTLGRLVNRDAKLRTILSAPTLSSDDKAAVVAELTRHCQSNATVKNFLSALAENNRLGLLGDVCAKFEELMSAARGEVEMVITSAQQLDNKTLTRLENAVAKSDLVAGGKKLKVTNTVNSDIVGGLIVEVGDRTIDLSVSSRIAKMNKLLTDTL